MPQSRNEQSYLAKFRTFFNRENFSSTYKPYFLKSLIEIADYDEGSPMLPGHQWLQKEGENLTLNLNFIAVRFLRFYGELYFKFKLKQSSTPLDANINRILESLRIYFDRKLPTCEFLASDRFAEKRKEVINSSIKPEVLPRLDRYQDLYTIVPSTDNILMNINIVTFFAKFRTILIPALNYTITRYLERINFAPRIAEKISGYIPRDGLTLPKKNIILSMHNECFYCHNICNDYDMDHVIPFHYIYQTELFNIVPACAGCNSAKSDDLPSQELFEEVKERNKKLQSQDLLRRNYSDDRYQELYDSCLNDFHGSRRDRYTRPKEPVKNGCRKKSRTPIDI